MEDEWIVETHDHPKQQDSASCGVFCLKVTHLKKVEVREIIIQPLNLCLVALFLPHVLIFSSTNKIGQHFYFSFSLLRLFYAKKPFLRQASLWKRLNSFGRELPWNYLK